MKKLILVALTALALIFLVGSVGAFENDNIGFGQCFIQCGVSILVEWFALKSLAK